MYNEYGIPMFTTGRRVSLLCILAVGILGIIYENKILKLRLKQHLDINQLGMLLTFKDNLIYKPNIIHLENLNVYYNIFQTHIDHLL